MRVRSKTQVASAANADEPDDRDRNAGDRGRTIGKLRDHVVAASQENRPSRATPEKSSRTKPSPGLFADAAQLRRPARRPFEADERQAAQDEQEGRA